jgi:hypothetical protein
VDFNVVEWAGRTQGWLSGWGLVRKGASIEAAGAAMAERDGTLRQLRPLSKRPPGTLLVATIR